MPADRLTQAVPFQFIKSSLKIFYETIFYVFTCFLMLLLYQSLF